MFVRSVVVRAEPDMNSAGSGRLTSDLLGRNSRRVRIAVSGRSDVGQIRGHNEDRFLVADLTTRDTSLNQSGRKFDLGPKGCMLLVADGMGGAIGGERASKEIVDSIEELCNHENLGDMVDIPSSMKTAVEQANRRIFDLAK